MKNNKCGNCQSDEVKPKHPPKAITICWNCAKLDCSWMRSLEPVAGWTAKKTDVGYRLSGGFHHLPSYCVESCPGYVPISE